ncbi:sirohydrochlorin chelatase [Thauera sp. WH-1]|uniref:sirohydrochlorin chelatase n=1 Tax=Thauera sp. WH-1 TaxID=3398230 RepID=UPI0039FB8D35
MNAASQHNAAIVLFGHGARDPEWAGPMRRIREAILARPDAPSVELAFLEFMTPTLPEAIASLAAAGARKVAVVPVFLAQGGHLKRDLPVLLDAARAAHPDCEIVLATAAGEAAPVVTAMAEYAASCLD